MAITVTDNRTLIDHADSTTGWSSPVAGESVTLFTSAPDPKEASGHVGIKVSNTEVELLHTHSSTDLSAGVLVYAWTFPQGVMDTTANYGVAAVLGDGTNTNAYQIGGSDQAVFRHDSGSNTNYQCILIDTGSLPGTGKALRGTFGNFDDTAVTEFGVNFTTTVKSVGGVENCYVDSIRYGNGGLTITGTDTSAYFLKDLAILDAASTSGGSYGICRDLGGGVFGLQGQLLLGDTTSGNDTLRMIGQTLKFENFSGVGTDKFGITIQGGSGTNNITFTDSTLFCPAGTGAFLTATDTDVESFDMTGCLVQNFDQGISFTTDGTNGPNHDISNNTFFGCSQINPGKTAFINNTINSTTDANGGLIIDSNTSLTNIEGLSFVSDGTGHAIYITATGTYEFTDFFYSGYGANGTTDAVIYNNSGGAVTINVTGGDTPTVRNGASATTTVNNAVTVKITSTTVGGAAIVGSRVRMEADSGGDLPSDDSVTITSTGTTASVSHTAHGLSNGNKVVIRGADQDEYNKIGTISNVTTNAYDYTITSRTNNLVRSEEFDNSSWVKTFTTINADVISAPDPYAPGTADQLIDNDFGGSLNAFTRQTFNVNTSTQYTFSIFLKAADNDWAQLVISGIASKVISAYFDLANGVIGATTGADNDDESIEKYANGWYRCSITFTTDVADAFGSVRIELADADNDNFINSDVDNSVYLWGAQLEEGSTVTPYIATTSTAVTSPATPATGTITSTAIILDDTTGAGGILQDTGFNYTSDQPVRGVVRKATTQPFYKEAQITGSITSNGYDQTVLLISDE